MVTSEINKQILYSLGRIESRIEANMQRFEAIEHKLDTVASKSDISNMDMRVTKLESNQTWVVRSVLGVFITTVVSFIAYFKNKLGV